MTEMTMQLFGSCIRRSVCSIEIAWITTKNTAVCGVDNIKCCFPALNKNKTLLCPNRTTTSCDVTTSEQKIKRNNKLSKQHGICLCLQIQKWAHVYTTKTQDKQFIWVSRALWKFNSLLVPFRLMLKFNVQQSEINYFFLAF